MNILLTNDDGYNQIGINLLKEILKDYGTVYIVAPKNTKSGASCSITINKPMQYHKYDEFNYELDGTPVDCVCFGINTLNVKFDLVVSGCNNGYNLSFDAVYSGTLGACFEALVYRIKTFAFSTQINNFDIVKKYGKDVIDYIFKNNYLANDHILNINFPTNDYKEIKGIKLTKQFFRKVNNNFIFNGNEVIASRNILEDGIDENDDTIAIKNGYVSITPLAKTSFSNDLYNKMKGN